MPTGSVRRSLFCLPFRNTFEKRKFEEGNRCHGSMAVFSNKEKGDHSKEKIKQIPLYTCKKNTGKCVPKSNDYFAKAVRTFSLRSTTASQTTKNASGQ
jgi:hypothetical protein